jgi:hypothetical protein
MNKWGWFFGWVGVVSLFLTVPLNLLANFLTPKVAAWWALTSIKRRERRILHLRKTCRILTARIHPRSRQESFLQAAYRFLLAFIVLFFIITNTLTETFYTVAADKGLWSGGVVSPTLIVVTNLIAYLGGLVFTMQAMHRLARASKVYLVHQLVDAEMELKRLEKTLPYVDNSPGQSK